MAMGFGVDGYCAPTESGRLGDCAAGAKGCFDWPLAAKVPSSGSTGEPLRRRGLQACIQLCLGCARCNYVSFSRLERDCSWYHACDLASLHPGADTGHTSLRVRDERGDTVAAVRELLEQRADPQATAAQARPRLVDLVIYGGPHYDAVLEARMHELSPLVDLYVVAEHVRPGGAAGAAFSAARPRFRPFANRTRGVLLPASTEKGSNVVPAFLDLELQDYYSRQRVLNSWQVAYKQVARDGDLVLVADADEIVRRSSLAALLRDAAALAALADNQAYAFQGAAFDFHPGCRAGNEDRAMKTGQCPRLLSGEALLHFGGGNVRDYAIRLPFTALPAASWHLRYFFSAEDVRGVLCRHPHAGSVQDATQFWAPKVVMRAAAALCAQPGRIRQAMEGCLDLWGRKADSGTAVAADSDDLPSLLLQRRQAWTATAINRVDELDDVPAGIA